MGKAIMETTPVINSNISISEIVRTAIHTVGEFRGHTCREKGIFTEIEEENACMNELQEELAEYNTRLVDMKTRIDEVQDDRKQEYLSRVENLENIRHQYAVKYGKLKKSSGDVWKDLIAATEEAWSELEFY